MTRSPSKVKTDVKAGSKLSQAGFLLGLFLNPEDGGDVPPKRRLTFNRLNGVISQKIVLFITTAVNISNPAKFQIFKPRDLWRSDNAVALYPGNGWFESRPEY
jgi:hypothetical protein